MNTISFEDFIPTSIAIGTDGIARARAKIARAGTQQYKRSQIFGAGEGTVTVLRPPDEIKKTARLFENQPISIEHQDISPDNKDTALQGLVGPCRFDDESHWIIADINLISEEAMAVINEGALYFSAAYDAEIIREAGEWIDEKGAQGPAGASYYYDAIQIPIRAIHVSLVRHPRAGAGATFIDSMDSAIMEKMRPQEKAKNMNYEEYKDRCGQMDMVEVEFGDKKYKLPDPEKMRAGKMEDSVAFETFKGVEIKLQESQRGLADSMKTIALLEQEVARARDSGYQLKIYEEKVAAWEDVRAIFTDSTGGVDENAPDFNPRLEAHDYYKKGLQACGVTVPDGLGAQELRERWEWSKSFLSAAPPPFADSSTQPDPIARIRNAPSSGRQARRMTELMSPSHLS